MTTSAPPAVVGAQHPRLHSHPPYASTAGPEAVELAARAGLHLYPWQQLVLRDALGETAAGKWAAFEVGLICPRQSGKGSILEALELAALYLSDPDEPPPLILHSAHEFKTSAEHFRRVRDLVEGSELLSKQVRIIRTAAGAESIELHSGARLRFVTRTGGSGRGFSADLVVIDEAYNLTAEAMAAVLPTLSARPNPQIWYTSSAGMTSSEQLARVRERGAKGGDPSLAFFEWSAADGSDLDDRQAWAQANPSLGLRIPESFIVTERAALPDEQFGRERLGLWADTGRGTGAIPTALWSSLADVQAERGHSPAFAVATAPDRSWAAIAAAWVRPDGGTQVSVADYRQTTTWVAERLAELRARWGGRVFVDAASDGMHLPGAVKLSVADQAKAHNALYDAAVAGTVHHYGDAERELMTANSGATWRTSGGSRVLAPTGRLDISPLVAVAHAAYGLTVVPASNYEDRGLLVL